MQNWNNLNIVLSFWLMFQDKTCMYSNKAFRLDFCRHKEKLGHSFLCYLKFLNTFF